MCEACPEMINHNEPRGVLRDEGPLPQGALDALSFINEKDIEIARLKAELCKLTHEPGGIRVCRYCEAR